MQFDLSRDFLDGLVVQHPQAQNGEAQIRAGGQLQFAPSSADGTMHTAIVSFALFLGDNEQQPFARGGWRFLFTSDQACKPQENQNHPFFSQLLVIGSGKLMVQFNNLLMHANLPMIPFDPSQMAVRQQGGATPPGVPAGAVPAKQQ